MFSDISSRVQENLSGVRVIRAYAQEAAELRKFEVLNRDYVHENIRLARLSALFMPLLQALIGTSFLVVLFAGGYQLLQHRISLGSFVMFNTYMGMLVWPMIALGWVVNLMQRGTASWSRIMELMREQPTIAAKKTAAAFPPDREAHGRPPLRACRNEVSRRRSAAKHRPGDSRGRDRGDWSDTPAAARARWSI